MPRIVVTGLPNSLQSSPRLRELVLESIPNAVERTPGFNIAARDVDVRAVPEMVDDRPQRLVGFNVEGLLDLPTRSSEMRRQLCDAIADELASFLAAEGVEYASILGWCLQIDRDGDAFTRRNRS